MIRSGSISCSRSPVWGYFLYRVKIGCSYGLLRFGIAAFDRWSSPWACCFLRNSPQALFLPFPCSLICSGFGRRLFVPITPPSRSVVLNKAGHGNPMPKLSQRFSSDWSCRSFPYGGGPRQWSSLKIASLHPYRSIPHTFQGQQSSLLLQGYSPTDPASHC
jgi:hypothetical protein